VKQCQRPTKTPIAKRTLHYTRNPRQLNHQNVSQYFLPLFRGIGEWGGWKAGGKGSPNTFNTVDKEMDEEIPHEEGMNWVLKGA